MCTVFSGSVGGIWWVTVSLSTVKSLVISFISLRLTSGKMLLSTNIAISSSSCCALSCLKVGRIHGRIGMIGRSSRGLLLFLWAWHLELEVCIMRDYHECDKSWSAENSVVLGFLVYYF